MKRLIFLLALFSLSFSSLLWETSTDGAITTTPLVADGSVLVGSSDGNVYALNPSNGETNWKTEIGGTFSDLIPFDGSVAVATVEGKVARMSKSGDVIWEIDLSGNRYNASRVYGIAATDAKLFATTDAGVFVMNKSATGAGLVYEASGTLTPPAGGENYIIFGYGDKLIRMKESGSIEWESLLDGDRFWLSRPVIDGTSVYVGALDNRLHAHQLTGGHNRWNTLTKNWVLSTPTVSGGVVYVGSNDGRVYAVYDGSGEVKWIAQTQLAVETTPEPGFMGGREVVFIGSTDKNVYAMETDSGEIVWKGSATDWAGSPLFHQNMVIFGSYDGSVYAFSTERACSITSPKEADVVGRKEVVVSGKYVSESGGASVYVNVNNGIWDKADAMPDGSWTYVFTPEEDLNSGLNVISCKVVDAAGEETGAKFTTVGISYDSSIALGELYVTLSPGRMEEEPFSVFVNDGDDGSPVNNFKLMINNQEYYGNGSVNITLPAGNYQFSVEKVGFEDYSSSVDVYSTGISPILLGAGVLVILIIIWLVWTRLIKPFRRK